MKKDLITIIVPVYNAEDYLERCLESIIQQTYYELEIILINDGSSDNSRIICEKLKKRDRRIIIINQHNQGVSATRNKGLNYANGEYICFIDADDWIEKDMILNLYNSIKNEDENSIAVCGCIEEYYKDGIWKYKKKYEMNIDKEIYGSDFREKSNLYLDIIRPELWNKLFKRNVIGKEKFDKDIILGEDLEFLSRLYCNAKLIKVINEQLYHFRIDISKNKKYHSTCFLDECKREDKIFCNLLNGNFNKLSIKKYFQRRIFLIAYTSCYYLVKNEKKSYRYIKNIINNKILDSNICYEPYGEFMKAQYIMRFFVKYKMSFLGFIYFNFINWRRR